MMRAIHQLVTAALLLSSTKAGTFMLYDLAGDTELTSIENHETYDLNLLGVGADPQVAVMYNDTNAGTSSVWFRIATRYMGVTEILSDQCDNSTPFFANTWPDSTPVAFPFPLGYKIKLLAYESSALNCETRTRRQSVYLTVVNTHPNWAATPEPTILAAIAPSPTPATPSPTTAAPVTPAPTEALATRLCSEETHGGDPEAFNICLNLPMPPEDALVFEAARDVWTSVITGDLAERKVKKFPTPEKLGLDPSCIYPSTEELDDLYVCGTLPDIDGVGGILGAAGPVFVRGKGAFPIIGIMTFDSADIEDLRNQNLLDNLILHEMGHVLGLGTLWSYLGITGPEENCPYLGEHANKAWELLSGCSVVPTELDGDEGLRCGNWDECMDQEVMTGFLDDNSILSNVTIAALHDLGYQVDYSKAEPFPEGFDFSACECPDERNLRPLQVGKTQYARLKKKKKKAAIKKKLKHKAAVEATIYGKQLLQKAKAARGFLPQDEQDLYMADKYVNVAVRDDEGTLGYVGVWGD